MIFRISNATQRLVGTLDDGEEFVETLVKMCKTQGVRAGEIRAVGQFSAIELVHFDSKARRYKPLVDGEGSFDLVSLNGNISTVGDEIVLRLDAVFNVLGPLGPQMVGGQLRRARVVSAEFVIDSFTDLQMERRYDAESGQFVLEKIERIAGQTPAPAPAPAAVAAPAAAVQPAASDSAEESEEEGPQMSWAEAVAETERTEKQREARKLESPRAGGRAGRREKDHDPFAAIDLDEPWLSGGDILDHPKLGRCQVLKLEGDSFAHIRLPRGRIRKLALEVFDIEYKGAEGGKNVFQARIRR